METAAVQPAKLGLFSKLRVSRAVSHSLTAPKRHANVSS